MGVINLKIIISRNEWLNVRNVKPCTKKCETNRRGERDVVSGARDTTSGRAGAVTDRQLLEVQPDQDDQGGQVASDVKVVNMAKAFKAFLI